MIDAISGQWICPPRQVEQLIGTAVPEGQRLDSLFKISGAPLLRPVRLDED
jgi:hypothetical protein